MNLTLSFEQKISTFRESLNEILDFVELPEFQSMLSEMWQLPTEIRHEFVELVILDTDEHKRRGLKVPIGMDMQRSWFEDERPTLFCVTKKLQPGMGWKIVTVTIDNPLSSGVESIWKPIQTQFYS